MRKLCLLSLICILTCSAFASNYFHPASGTTGNWNNDADWDYGVPPLSDPQEIKLTDDETVCIVDQDQGLYATQKISIAGGPIGATVELQSGGYLGSGKEFRVGAHGVGGNGDIGTLNQSGGTLEIDTSGKLFVGYKAGSVGTYTISGGSLLGTNGGRMFIGCGGEAGSAGTLIIQGTAATVDFDTNWIYVASDSAAGDSRLGTGTLQFDLSAGAVSPIVANHNISIDAGGGGTANLIVNADVEPVADIVLVQNTTANPIVGAFDTLNGGSAAEGAIAVIGGAVMQLTYQYNADGDGQNNDIALVYKFASTDLAHDPNPSDGAYVPSDLSQLIWVNPDPNDGSSPITCTVYLGTEPNRLDVLHMDKKVITTANPTSIAINETNFPISYDEVNGGLYATTTYYWFVDCDDPSSSPSLISGLQWSFLVAQAPQVNAGSDQAVWLDPNEVTVYLNATVTDADTPDPDLLWTQVINDAPTVTIDPNDIEDPTITFTERGDYEFMLTANDDVTEAVSDTVRIVVGNDACDASHILSGNPYNDADYNQDCIVDLVDFIELIAADWLNCTDTLTSCGN